MKRNTDNPTKQSLIVKRHVSKKNKLYKRTYKKQT